MSAKNVLIVCHYYAPHLGGIEMVAASQAERLAALGHDVSVVTSRVNRQEKSGLHDRVRLVRIRAWNGLEKHGIPFPVFSPRLWPVMWREVGRADIVHIHDVFYLTSWVAAICAVVRKRPIILTQHVASVPHPNPIVHFAERFVYATAGRFIFHKSARILTLNDRVEAFVRAYGVPAVKFRFVPNGVDCSLFQSATAQTKRLARQRLGLPQDKKIVLFVGRMVPKKGFDKVLAAQSDQYLLVFAGGKPQHASNTETVRFLGQVAPAALAEIYQAADLFILPSEGEGFPLTVQEAMASGLPVILGDDPGYRRYQLEPSKVELLAMPTSAEAIEDIIQSLLGDTARLVQMAAYSRQFAQTQFAWERVIAALEKVYDSAARKTT